MAITKPTKPYTFTNGAGNIADASQVNDVFDTLYDKANELIDILNALAGSALTPDARVDIGHNEDGTHKSGITGGAEFISTVTPTYVSTTSFTVSGDQTAIFLPTRKIQATITGLTVYSEIVSSSYNGGTGLTTVTILDAVLNNTLSAVNVSVLRPTKDSGAVSMTSLRSKVKSVTGAYTTTLNDDIILADATGGAFTVTLLSAATAGAGKKYFIMKTDSTANAVTIDGNGSETINGALTRALSAQYAYAVIVSDGSNWFVIAADVVITDITTTKTHRPKLDSGILYLAEET